MGSVNCLVPHLLLPFMGRWGSPDAKVTEAARPSVRTGNPGTVTPMRNYQNTNGQTCRQFQQDRVTRRADLPHGLPRCRWRMAGRDELNHAQQPPQREDQQKSQTDGKEDRTIPSFPADCHEDRADEGEQHTEELKRYGQHGASFCEERRVIYQAVRDGPQFRDQTKPHGWLRTKTGKAS